MAALAALARSWTRAISARRVEKIALYKLGDRRPLTADEVAACAPSSTEAALDDVLHIVAEARSGRASAR